MKLSTSTSKTGYPELIIQAETFDEYLQLEQLQAGPDIVYTSGFDLDSATRTATISIHVFGDEGLFSK